MSIDVNRPAAAVSATGVHRRSGRLQRAALWTWTLIGAAALFLGGWWLFRRLDVVLVPAVLALFPTAAVFPLVEWLARRRVPRPLATSMVLTAVLVVLVGVGLLVVPPFLAELPALRQTLTEGGTQLDSLLSRLPSAQPNTTLGDLAQRATLSVVGGASALLSTALAIGAGVLLVVVLWACYLSGGHRIARTGLGLLPARLRDDAHDLGRQLWQTLGSYVRALSVVALVDATAVAVGLWLLGVPLVLPLALLVFVGAFFPFVGAFVSGLFAVLVALAELGVGTALAVLGLVVVVQQVDGNIVQPLVMGKVVRLSAVTVIVAVALGASLLGVLGAFLAVPVAAALATTIRFVRTRDRTDEDCSSRTW